MPIQRDNLLRCRGAEVCFAIQHAVDGCQEVCTADVFCDIAVCALADASVDMRFTCMDRQDENLELRKPSSYLFDGLDPVHLRHRKIHEDEIGRQPCGSIYELAPVLDLGDDPIA